MDESILNTIKALLNVSPSDTNFDKEITLDINGVLMILNGLGVGPKTGFRVTSVVETWRDFIGDRDDLDGTITYIHQKVRLLFDPPQNAFLVENIKAMCAEFEWRLNSQVEGGPDYA